MIFRSGPGLVARHGASGPGLVAASPDGPAVLVGRIVKGSDGEGHDQALNPAAVLQAATMR
ncbi:hypothetical protein [Streptomyces triticisoli]|uniref:hypothetical protein n=1 Tax=Streptomyces triticisoli TaxID=2182797 RepID=UPI0013007596|nr:hypothetical protein [Streptomyces triticisoli]